MHFPRFPVVVVMLVLLGACTGPAAPFQPEAMSVPAATPAEGPRLSGGGALPLVLSWMEADTGGSTLRYAGYRDGAWSEPRTVVSGVDMFVNWADMPSVQPMGDDRLAAHWLEMSADAPYAYDVVFVQSADGGATWSPPLRPHDDGTPTEHGFVSMFRGDSGVGLVWLDGRKYVNEVTDDPVASGMTLRAAFIDPDSTTRGEQLLDELICDCCQTDVAIAASGPVAVYRDRSVDEIRDISITRFVDGAWQPGVPLSEDHWKIPGCPVNGPSVAARGNVVAAAWFTAAGDEPRVRLRFSTDSGAGFGDVIEVAQVATLGRVGIVLLDDDTAAVSWVQKAEDGRNELLVQRFTVAGDGGTPHSVARGVGTFSVPQMARAGNELVFVWSETEDFVNSVHSARVAAGSL